MGGANNLDVLGAFWPLYLWVRGGAKILYESFGRTKLAAFLGG